MLLMFTCILIYKNIWECHQDMKFTEIVEDDHQFSEPTSITVTVCIYNSHADLFTNAQTCNPCFKLCLHSHDNWLPSNNLFQYYFHIFVVTRVLLQHTKRNIQLKRSGAMHQYIFYLFLRLKINNFSRTENTCTWHIS